MNYTDRRSLSELMEAAVFRNESQDMRDDIHEIEVFLADLVARRRVPLTGQERTAIHTMAKVARATRARVDFGKNPHPVEVGCGCGNCRAGV